MTLSGSRATGANAAIVSSGQPEPFAVVVGSPSHHPSLLRQSSSHRPGRRTPLATARGRPRDRTITWVKQLGRRRWKQASGYHRQGRAENAFSIHVHHRRWSARPEPIRVGV